MVKEANGPIILWVAIPCTGGSSWQHVNRARFKRTGNEEALARIDDHWVVYRKLWSSFVTVAEAVRARGGHIAIEWPHRCDYWRDRRVVNYLRRHPMFETNFNGCAYGLKSQNGLPICKPWKVLTTLPGLASTVSNKCNNAHVHAGMTSA